MFRRQKTGSVVCPSCGRLVGVNDERCLNCGRVRPGMWGFAGLFRKIEEEVGFLQIVIWGTVALYVATLLYDPSHIGMGGIFRMLSPSTRSLFLFGASGALPVFQYDRWWTLLSAGWLHGGLLHILFNILWVRQLGPETAELYGAGRTVIIYTVASVAGFALSSVAVFLPRFLQAILGGGAGVTLGASAAIFGLLGAMVHYSRRGGSSAIGQQAWMWAAILFVFGFFFRGVDNWAHLGGFLGGWGVSFWLDPRKPERVDHLVGAALCLLLTAGAIAASIVTGLRFVR